MYRQTQDVHDVAQSTGKPMTLSLGLEARGNEGAGVTSVRPTVAEGLLAGVAPSVEVLPARTYRPRQGAAGDSVDRRPASPQYDYTNQAWVVDGLYVACGHERCGECYGTVHQGEAANLANEEVI